MVFEKEIEEELNRELAQKWADFEKVMAMESEKRMMEFSKRKEEWKKLRDKKRGKKSESVKSAREYESEKKMSGKNRVERDLRGSGKMRVEGKAESERKNEENEEDKHGEDEVKTWRECPLFEGQKVGGEEGDAINSAVSLNHVVATAQHDEGRGDILGSGSERDEGDMGEKVDKGRDEFGSERETFERGGESGRAREGEEVVLGLEATEVGEQQGVEESGSSEGKQEKGRETQWVEELGSSESRSDGRSLEREKREVRKELEECVENRQASLSTSSDSLQISGEEPEVHPREITRSQSDDPLYRKPSSATRSKAEKEQKKAPSGPLTRLKSGSLKTSTTTLPKPSR